MKLKRFLSVILLSVFLVSFCSFSVSADDDIPVSDFDITLKREVTDGSTTSTYNFDYTVSTYNNTDLNIYRPVNYEDFWATGGSKIFVAFNAPNLIAGHEYQMTFTIGVSFNANWSVKVLNGSENVFEDTFSGGSPQEISVSFTAPDYVGPSHQVSIILTVPAVYNFGTATTGFYFSKSIGWNDNTDNPGWLGKILQKFTDLGDRISGFFTNLADSIGGFFSDLKQSIVNQFNNVKQWFIDLGNDIKGFFTSLKNYLLYFEDPVTLDSNGVPIGADGKPVYTNPFASKIDEFEQTINGWLTQIQNFVNQIGSAGSSVSSYIENGSSVVTGVLGAVPVLTAVLTFALVLLVVRKVVGR